MSGTSTISVAGGSADVRLTPWDERALGMRTAEIIGLQADSSEAGMAVLAGAEQWCDVHGVRYLFGRFDASSSAAKGAVLASGHAIVECSLTLARRGLDGLPQAPARMRPQLREFCEADLPELERIAREDFQHGRFLEDPAIDAALAATRTANWIGDLARQGLLRTAESGGRVIGFHAERVDPASRHADLILTGATARYAMLGLPLWIVALDSLRERGVTSCSTLVSAANTGIVNLYAKLGFRYETTLFGFRKFL
jgi:Sortase and related acyltransferases